MKYYNLNKMRVLTMAFIVSALSFGLYSCQDFLTVYPENQMSSEEFLQTEKDMEIYCNGFLQRMLPGGLGLCYADANSDNVATRTSTSFLIGDTWRPEDQGGWSWTSLRDVNWFLDNLPRAKSNVSEATYNHYEGVGRFWRAYFYYNMVKTFGDVPWYDHELQSTDNEALYKPRDSREFVMDKVLEDLNFASQHCSSDIRVVASSTKISRWVALAFKARVCLFEGTYRKYHTELGLQNSANKFLNEAVSASETLMQESPYGLVKDGDVKTQYRSLFTSDDLNTREVIFGVAYKTGVRMHNVTWYTLSASAGSSWSMTKQFVNQYLMLDGTRFTDKAGYETMPYTEEFKNRDNRMAQTLLSPDYVRKVNGVVQPVAPEWGITNTGYEIIKWVIDDDVHIGMTTSVNSLPLFRFGEVLLNYAEAKAELGEMNEAIWNQTIRPLRERAGVNGVVPAAYDPYLAAYYLNQTTDKWILEIRRERAIEMASELVRYDDIMRWKMGELLELPWYGIYIDELDKGYDLNGDGKIDLTVSTTGSASTSRVVLGSAFRLSEGDHGYIEYGHNIGRMWTERKYLRPIPTTAYQMNPNLGQNPGWGE